MLSFLASGRWPGRTTDAKNRAGHPQPGKKWTHKAKGPRYGLPATLRGCRACPYASIRYPVCIQVDVRFFSRPPSRVGLVCLPDEAAGGLLVAASSSASISSRRFSLPAQDEYPCLSTEKAGSDIVELCVFLYNQYGVMYTRQRACPRIRGTLVFYFVPRL